MHPAISFEIKRRGAWSLRCGQTVNAVFAAQRISSLSAGANIRPQFDPIACGVIFECRLRWAPKTLALWDTARDGAARGRATMQLP